jgi:hypothetical protein
MERQLRGLQYPENGKKQQFSAKNPLFGPKNYP